MNKIRVLVVDDSAFVRRAVARMLAPLHQVEVVGAAATGEEAVRLNRELDPDVVLLDVHMPGMDGLEALRRIMAEHPTRVLMLSSLTREDADVTLRSLELGAVDFVDKSSAGTVIDIYGLAPTIREKVLAVAGASVTGSPPRQPARAVAPATPVLRPMPSEYDVIAIGSSTGGPRALVDVLAAVPPDLGACILIAQHMPPGFTHTLAERLNRRSPLPVREARGGEPVRPGTAWVGPGGRQMAVEPADGGLRVRVEASAPDLLHRPSVDHLFRSVADHVGRRAIGVVLTGMGDDGAAGLRLLREAGARTISESKETSVIFGMPRAAADAADFVLPLHEIGPALGALCAGRSIPSGSTT